MACWYALAASTAEGCDAAELAPAAAPPRVRRPLPPPAAGLGVGAASNSADSACRPSTSMLILQVWQVKRDN